MYIFNAYPFSLLWEAQPNQVQQNTAEIPTVGHIVDLSKDELCIYQKQALEKAEANLSHHYEEATRVLGQINDQASYSSSDYIILFENSRTVFQFPYGFKAYRDIGWRPCPEFIKGIMEKEPTKLSIIRWTGSGGFRRGLKLSDEAFLRILSHESNSSPLQGYLLNIAHPKTGKSLIIDAHDMSEDIEQGHGTLAEFGPIFWEGQDVTKEFWGRLDEMIADLSEENKSCTFPGIIEDLPIQEENGNLEDLKNALDALTFEVRKIDKKWAYYIDIDAEWKIDRVRSILESYLECYGGPDPIIKHGCGWRLNIFHEDLSNKGRKWTLSEFESLFGMEGGAYDERVRFYRWEATFATKTCLEQAISKLCSEGIVNPLQLVVKNLSLYIFDTIDFKKAKKLQKTESLLEPQSFAIPKPIKRVPLISIPGANPKDKLAKFFELLCPAVLRPFFRVEAENDFVTLTPLTPPNIPDKDLYYQFIHEALKLMLDILGWQGFTRSCMSYTNKLYIAKEDLNVFISAIQTKRRLICFIKARFLAAARLLGEHESILSSISPEEHALILESELLYFTNAAQNQLLLAAKEGEDHRIPYLVRLAGNPSYVLEQILCNLQHLPKTSTCNLLIKAGAKPTQKMLYYATSAKNIPLIELLQKNGINLQPNLETDNPFLTACRCGALEVIELLFKDVNKFDSDIRQKMIDRGFAGVLKATHKVNNIFGARFLFKQGAQMDHKTYQGDPIIISIGLNLYYPEKVKEVIELLREIETRRSPEQLEKDIENYIREQMCFIQSPLTKNLPDPKDRSSHLMSFYGRRHCPCMIKYLLKFGYGKESLYRIINDDSLSLDPIEVIHRNAVQMNLLEVLEIDSNEILEKIIAREKKVLASCMAYLFDKRAIFDHFEQHFLDNYVTHLKSLNMGITALTELDKYRPVSDPWREILINYYYY